MQLRLLQVLVFIELAASSAAGPGLVLVLWSQVTPAEMREAAFACEAHSDIVLSVEYSALSNPPALTLPIAAVVDILWSESYSRLYLASKAIEAPVINGNSYTLKDTIALDLDVDIELEKLARVSEWLGVKRLCVFLPPQSNLQSIVQSTFSGVQVEVLRVSEVAGKATLDVLVRKQIAPFGFTAFLILLPPLATKHLLLAFHYNQLTKNRLIVLLSSKASIHRFSITDEELPGFRYLHPLYVTRRQCNSAEIISEQLLCLVSQAASNPNYSEISLMQTVNRTAKRVGWIHGEGIDLSGYQEAEIQPNSSKALSTIQISINSGRENPSGVSYFEQLSAARGALVAQRDINERTSLLPYFNLEIQNVSLGVDEFEATWAQNQLAKSDLGVALIHGTFSRVAIGAYQILRSMNCSIPQVGASIVHSILSSVSLFPMFSRVGISDTYITVIYFRMMKLFGWKRVCFLFANETWDDGLTEFVFARSKEMEVEIANHNNRLPSGAQANSTELLRTLQEVVESKVRVLVLIAYGSVLENVLVALYNLGMRSGDLILVATDWLTPSLYEIADSERLKQVKELTQGAIMFIPASFIGPIGASVYQKYIENYGVDPLIESCFYYDAAMIIAYALDDIIQRGESWFEPLQLIKTIRHTRFTGCTGFVYIEEKTNDRALMSSVIVNARMQADGSVKAQAIGTYDPSSTMLFNFSEAIQWPGRGTSVPTDVRENVPGCPFELTHVASYTPAAAVATAVISCLSLISICSSLYLWRKYWNFETTPLKTRVLASFEDYFVFAVIAIESLQCLAVGLELCDWAVLLKWSANLLAVRFQAFASVGSAGAWCLFYIAVGTVVLWTALLALSKFTTDGWWKCVCDHSNPLAETVCPLLGEVCFLPVLSTLLAVFQCPKVVSKVTESESLYRAYLEWDCNQFCWSGSHLPFAIVAFICVSIYTPTAVFMRPAWQFIPLSLHVHTSPSFLMLKSIYQVAIATVDRVLKSHSPLHATVAFVALTVLFGVGTLKVKPYNYSRANLWHSLSLLFTLHTSILHIVSGQFPAVSSTWWLLLLLLGLGAIAVFGLVYQAMKLPVKLRSGKSIQVTDLFRFMFSRNGRYMHIFTKTRMSSENESESVRRVPMTLR